MNSNDGSRPVSSPLGPTPVSLATGVRSDGHVLGRSLAFRDDEESIALKHYILDLRDEVRRQDDELARIVSNALVHRPGDGQDARAVLHAAFAQHVDEGAGGAGVALLDRLVDLPRSHLVPSDPFLAKAHPGSIRTGRGSGGRLQEAAAFELHELAVAAPGTGRPPRWVRRIIIAAFVVKAVVGLVVGLTGLLTHCW
jgi:hypothetical protein